MPLRPLSLGEIYDGSFQALRTNPRTMLGVTAAVVTLMALVNLVAGLLMARSVSGLLSFEASGPTEAELSGLFAMLGTTSVAVVLTMVVTVVAATVITGLLTVAVSDSVLGRRMPVAELWRRARGRLLPLLGLTVLVGLTVAGAIVLALAPGVALLFVDPVAGGLALVAGVLLAIGGSLWLTAKLALATPALMLEGTTVLGAWRRSWQLTRGSFWRVLGILLLTMALTAVAVGVLTVPFQFGAMALMALDPGDPLAAAGMTPAQLGLQAVGEILSSTVIYPFAAAVTALLYVDIRMRREGLDVQLARQSGQAAA